MIGEMPRSTDQSATPRVGVLGITEAVRALDKEVMDVCDTGWLARWHQERIISIGQ